MSATPAIPANGAKERMDQHFPDYVEDFSVVQARIQRIQAEYAAKRAEALASVKDRWTELTQIQDLLVQAERRLDRVAFCFGDGYDFDDAGDAIRKAQDALKDTIDTAEAYASAVDAFEAGETIDDPRYCGGEYFSRVQEWES